MRFLFACGGTGGHINPALAVAQLVKEKRPNSEILFVGSVGSMETRLVPDAGFEIKTIEASPISRRGGIKGIIDNLVSIKRIIKAEREAAKIISGFSPDVVMGTGGYVCYPALAAASKLKIPCLIHESNALPGLATRALAKKVDKVLLNFNSGSEFFSKNVSCSVVGTPIRNDILMYDKEQARRELGVEKPLLVSFWGSLGAREMNKKIAEVLKLESEHSDFCHIHATGKYGYAWMPEHIKSLGVDIESNENITIREYINDMPRVLAAADVVMCRGGAATLSEICGRGVPAIIVPSPNVTDNHQYKNALELEKIGGAIVIEEKDAEAKLLYDTAKKLLFDEEKRKSMSAKLVANAVLDASERIYSEMMSLIKK